MSAFMETVTKKEFDELKVERDNACRRLIAVMDARKDYVNERIQTLERERDEIKAREHELMVHNNRITSSKTKELEQQLAEARQVAKNLKNFLGQRDVTLPWEQPTQADKQEGE